MLATIQSRHTETMEKSPMDRGDGAARGTHLSAYQAPHHVMLAKVKNIVTSKMEDECRIFSYCGKYE
jgi:hypothetical protein